MKVPTHLRKYVVEQHYERYTPEDQAVWRYIMRRLKHFLSRNAHPCYAEGLQKTGIEIDNIPNIQVMNEKLQKFGWGAVPVSGFIPPAAFMEFQSLGILPIASDMRTLNHVLYTPAPDIVHEAAGHAPILIDPQFAAYLKAYAQVAKKAIISHEDLALYEAIRDLSDIKENPSSTPEQIREAENNLNNVSASISYVSEAGYLGRMNWWTAEYGLIGETDSPKIFGAGLLSSVGEASACLSDKVKKIPLNVDCLNYSYDITEPQPQLFVTPDFEHLTAVLEQMAEGMSFRRGGIYGIKEAIRAKTVNTIELDTGLQISGVAVDFLGDVNGQPEFFRFEGPTQLSYQGEQLEGHGKDYHAHGYSTPIGPLKDGQSIATMNESELAQLNLVIGKTCELLFASGACVTGKVKSLTKKNNTVLLMAFNDCRVTMGDKVLFEPEWGVFDMAVGLTVTSVFGGPADRKSYGETEDFVAARVPTRKFSDQDLSTNDFLSRIRNNRDRNQPISEKISETTSMIDEYLTAHRRHWLIGLELLELAHRYDLPESTVTNLTQHLLTLHREREDDCISAGIALAPMVI